MKFTISTLFLVVAAAFIFNYCCSIPRAKAEQVEASEETVVETNPETKVELNYHIDSRHRFYIGFKTIYKF